ncbi:hypothetical protein [Lysobacter enzymogenes]|uniref:hypothetical protein n=1 Tax=Lysobacter enzymogenes TaxID=69 RepID=UPI00089664EC|nr:hypothetical protein [Lysobacter enzymogenes]SDX52538.1 hypothetical protein SAMN05421681_10619 [Lysobacter enzymogenes]
MSEELELAREFRVGMERLEVALSRLDRGNGSNATINVNAGGIGVWLAATCCLAMLAAGFVGGLWMVSDRAEIRSQLRERRDGENAIRAYINTGVLKPRAEPEKK